jgi:hypothetical protein
VVAGGGAAGGLLNGLLAPLLLDRVWEYPAALVASTLVALGCGHRIDGLLDRRYGRHFAALLRTITLLGMGLLVVLAASRGVGAAWMLALGAVALTVLWVASSRALAVGASMALLATTVSVAVEGGDLENTRTFYGTYRIVKQGDATVLVHGTTVHGTQFRDERSSEPTTYYSRSGPLGDVFNAMRGRAPEVGVVGLGTGTVAAYGTTDQTMTFYEIDPEMVRIAQDKRRFSYLADSSANIRVVTGDGRLRVQESKPRTFDLLVLDAFSSDSIPVHLLTREAFAMYSDRLAPDGVLAVHVSNRVFDLEPVVAAAAHELGYSAALGVGAAGQSGASSSAWIVLSAKPTAVTEIAGDAKWRPLHDRRVAWTDDYSSVLTVLRGAPIS